MGPTEAIKPSYASICRVVFKLSFCMLCFHTAKSERLRRELRAAGPRAVLLFGPARTGKTTLVRREVQGRPSVWFRGSSLPAALLAREHAARIGGREDESAEISDWAGFSTALGRELAAGRMDGSVVVWDQADRLIRDPRWRQMLEQVWSELRARARPLHLVLITRTPPAAEALSFLASPSTPLASIQLRPLALREATGQVPGWSPLRQLTAYALLGGEPEVWDRIDPEVRLSTNLIRLFLEPGAPLRRFADERFPIPGRNPERSLALVDALARGAREWGELKEEARVFRTSSELGPYMKRLHEEGLIESRRPLDARPGGRRRRHLLSDPLLATWHRLLRPHLADLDGGASPRGIWKDRIRPRLPQSVARRLPDLLADHLRRHGEEQLHARARETGGLWGDGIDIPLAGILSNGSAIYGSTSWADPGPDAVGALARQVAETRYGYGRESRSLVLLAVQPVAWDVQRSVTRRADAVLLGPGELLGNGIGSGE